MDKLKQLIEKCKCGVHINVNYHLDYSQTVEQYFASNQLLKEDLEDIDESTYEEMKKSNTVVELQYYPETSVGFFKIYHYDVEKAIDEALLTFN